MATPRTEVIERKLAFFRKYLHDLGVYGALDEEGRRREHYAIERLLQLLCESAADLSQEAGVREAGVRSRVVASRKSRITSQ